MTIQEWNELSVKIASNGGDQAVLTTLLTQATDGFAEEAAKAENAIRDAEQLRKENEGLRKANMDLFLRIGEQVSQEKEKEPEKTKAETIKIEDLFKE